MVRVENCWQRLGWRGAGAPLIVGCHKEQRQACFQKTPIPHRDSVTRFSTFILLKTFDLGPIWTDKNAFANLFVFVKIFHRNVRKLNVCIVIDNEQITLVALYKRVMRANRSLTKSDMSDSLFFRSNCTFALLLSKKDWFAQTNLLFSLYFWKVFSTLQSLFASLLLLKSDSLLEKSKLLCNTVSM